ncbi:MAG: nucleoside deaminase [bacterium]|nr:nucleoside deaminase [bacterium]
MLQPQEKFMRAAIEEAVKAKNSGDYAIGAIIVRDGKIIVRAKNSVKIDQDSTCHAEMVAIRDAMKALGSGFLLSCVLYTTNEPCPMCASAAVWARMEGIIFGSTLQDMIAYRLEKGSRKWSWRTIDVTTAEIVAKGEPKLEIVEGFMRDNCLELFHS